MRWTLLMLSLACLRPGVAFAGEATGPGLTVRAGGLSIKVSDLVMTATPEKVFVLWDALPYRQDLGLAAGVTPAVAGDPLALVVAGLAQSYAFKRNPGSKLVHVTVVEFPERDSYGTPRYEMQKILGEYEVAMNPKTHKPLPPRPLPR